MTYAGTDAVTDNKFFPASLVLQHRHGVSAGLSASPTVPASVPANFSVTQMARPHAGYPGGRPVSQLSEVSRNRQLTVQFLCAEFAAVSEVNGKKSLLSSKNRRFVYVCAYKMENCCLSSRYSALFLLSTESHHTEIGRPRWLSACRCFLV